MRWFRALKCPMFLVVLLAIGSALAPQLLAAANESIALDTGWQFSQSTDTKGVAIKPKWLPAKVPGDVHLDLLHNKLIPPPFYRDNEAKLQWIENADWEYRTTVSISPELLNRGNIDLVLDGLDTCASVYVNGKLVLTSDNMFRTYRVSAKPLLKLGANQLLVSFSSPIRCAARIAAKDKWNPDTHTAAQWYIRKAAYQYGWDWSPRYVTSGIWKPIRLEAWDNTRISNFAVRQLDVTSKSAHILAQVEVTAVVDTQATIKVNYQAAGRELTAIQNTELHPGINYVDIPVTLDHPKLWYPAGYGSQPMYVFHANVAVGGVTQDASLARTGIRSVVLRREPDQWGRSFEFVVNGIPIFVKGANVVPFDSFSNRVKPEQIRYILQSAKDANMNMIRIWGGGYYETQEFYQICDELGIMVWQDFMFGNPWQPGTYSFKQNVAQEVEDQLKRLRNHPSIVLWCGNNEQENNFLQDSVKVTPGTRLQMWEDYLTVFSGIIPTLVARYAPEAVYWPSTPSADYEETKDRNYRLLEDGDDVGGNEESGDTHDYTIWASKKEIPRVPFDSEENRHYRFVTEYGFQSFPEMRTIDSFTLPEDRTSTSTAVMTSHQKDANGYQTIHDYMLQYYGQPKSLDSLVYASQVLQAEFIKLDTEHLRRDRPRTMGALFWQLNDCWPVVSPSSIDYYGRWKALQYYARRFYAPLLVSSRVKDGAMVVNVVSDKTEPTPASLRLRIMKFDGTVVSDQTQPINVPALSSNTYILVPIDSVTKAKGIDPADVFAAMDLTVDAIQVSSNVMYFVSTKQVHLPATRIESQFTGANGSYNLHLSSGVLARSVYISFGNTDAKLSDNYFDLLPGQSMDVHVNSNEGMDSLKKSMKVVSLADAFVTDSTQRGFAWK